MTIIQLAIIGIVALMFIGIVLYAFHRIGDEGKDDYPMDDDA